MNPLHTLRDPARRQFLRNAAWAASGAIVGSVIGQAVIDPIVEPVAEPIREALYGVRRVETFRATPYNVERVASHGNDHQRAALDSWRNGTELPAFAVERATMTHPGPAGDQWQEWQGDVASRLLWGGRQPRDVPMRARPDKAFGEWAEIRVRDWRGKPEPAYVRVVGEEVMQATGRRLPQDYTILGLPLRNGRVLTVSAPWLGGSPAATPRRDPTTHIPGSEARDHDRLASI